MDETYGKYNRIVCGVWKREGHSDILPPAPGHVNSVYVYVRMRVFFLSISMNACVLSSEH